MNFELSDLLSAFIAAVFWLALTKIKQLRRSLSDLQTNTSDPPPACLRCEFYKAAKEEFKHGRAEITGQIDIKSRA